MISTVVVAVNIVTKECKIMYSNEIMKRKIK